MFTTPAQRALWFLRRSESLIIGLHIGGSLSRAARRGAATAASRPAPDSPGKLHHAHELAWHSPRLPQPLQRARPDFAEASERGRWAVAAGTSLVGAAVPQGECRRQRDSVQATGVPRQTCIRQSFRRFLRFSLPSPPSVAGSWSERGNEGALRPASGCLMRLFHAWADREFVAKTRLVARSGPSFQGPRRRRWSPCMLQQCPH